ncbi:MAG: diacylglycerol kinase family protein [Actinomycetota bacterium]|nr:diacylglycerol kinase family protein [Actinomycetota bacterium]
MDSEKKDTDFIEKPVTHRKHSLLKSFKCAAKGIARVILTQRSFRIQLLMFVLTVIAGFIFHISTTEWLFILLIGCMVLSLEMINTCLEFIIDLVTEGYRIHAKHIKDISAGAVLVSSLIALIGGLIIFIPYLLALF